MRAFTEMIMTIGASTKTTDKIAALAGYFSTADDRDRVWVIALFSGRKPRRPVSSTQLAQWCTEYAGLEWWLFEECYHVVGDLAETIALLLPADEKPRMPGKLHYYLEKLMTLEREDISLKKQFIIESWQQMNRDERFVFNKLFTGGFRIGVSQNIMVQALARTVKLEASVIAHRISGKWDPVTTGFHELLEENETTSDPSRPYPFYLAYALDEKPAWLGDPGKWQAEWKWDGIRGQIIRRNGELFVWSRGEELVTSKFPEFHSLAARLPDGTVLDGEITALEPAPPGSLPRPLPFSLLQTRISRKNITRKQLQQAPVGFIAYDLLEYGYKDLREEPLQQRRAQLEKIVRISHPALRISPAIEFGDWDELARLRDDSRSLGAEGLMLKRLDSKYQSGRRRGDWWKWKIDALTIDAVLIYAQKGAGKRSNLYTAYTFAVKDGDRLVPFTRAYSGLTDREIAEVDAFVRKNAVEKFGPVRTVRAELVFEIAFEGIAASNRHRSGVALRFPRISRWRKDKNPDEINTLDDLRNMLQIYGTGQDNLLI